MLRTTVLGGLLLAVTALTGCDTYGTKLEFKSGELYYTDKVTEAAANTLGQFLVKKGYFNDDKRVSVQLTRENDVYQVRMVVVDDYKSVYPKSFQIMAAAISVEVFGGKTVEIHLTDNTLETREVIQADKTFRKVMMLLKKSKAAKEG
ncbi:MAG: hypothetical protein ACE5KM_04080 [Planctomycetaceae bacterium]